MKRLRTCHYRILRQILHTVALAYMSLALLTRVPGRMSANKPRGGPAEWTTEEQRLWLEGRLPAYTSAQTNGSKMFGVFWAATFDEWFKCWPNEEPTEEEKSKDIDEALKMKKMKAVSK